MSLFRNARSVQEETLDGPEDPVPDAALSPLDEVIEEAETVAVEELPEATPEPPPVRDELADELEAALHQLASQMTTLSANFEEVRRSRDQLEKKVDGVEQRMVSLGSLAEAVSIQYNPFLSDQRPDDPAWAGRGNGNGNGNGNGKAHAPGAPASPTPPPAPPEVQGLPALPAPIDIVPVLLARATPAQSKSLEDHLLQLEWVGLMLGRVGRAGFMDLLDYYESLGWLSAATKERTARLALGIQAPDRVGDGSWVNNIELHRRSLLVLQALEGNSITVDRREKLRLDVRRLVEG